MPEIDLSNLEIVDFNKEIKGNWSQVCFIQPYTRDIDFESRFGFKWELEKNTNIQLNDGYAVLIFRNKTKVLSYFKVLRSPFDFTQLGRSCVSRDTSKFSVKDNVISFA